MITETAIHDFLPNLEIKKLPQKIEGLPLLFRENYLFTTHKINDVPCLMITLKDQRIGMKEIEKHGQILEKKYDLPIIWIFPKMDFYKVRELIRRGINFVIPQKQVHLPLLNMSIKKEREQPIQQELLDLDPIAIQILIHQILKTDLEGLNKSQLAEKLQVIPMTITRAIRGILAIDLLHEQQIGQAKVIRFANREKLWNFVKERVTSPIRGKVYVNKIPKNLPFGNISALAKTSLIAEDLLPTYVIHRLEKNQIVQFLTNEIDAIAEIELWDRKPTLIHNACINPIDLYLTLKDDTDERVQLELGKVLAKEGLRT